MFFDHEYCFLSFDPNLKSNFIKMFNLQLSSRPNENETLSIENPILDQFDLLNDFENLNDKVDSLAIIFHAPKPETDLYTKRF